MGINILKRSCNTNTNCTAPDPSPDMWNLIEVIEYKWAYIVIADYIGCTNFEGRKILVFDGKYNGLPDTLDPHFSESDDSPIARFKPTNDGFNLAMNFADSI